MEELKGLEQQDRIKTHEQIAMEKIINPFVTPYQYWHQTLLYRLPSILQYGLLSWDAAKKMGIKYDKRYYQKENKDSVSIASDTTPFMITTPEIGILVDPKKIPPKELLRKGEKQEFFKELLVPDKIIPDSFSGLVIGNMEIEIYDDGSSGHWPSGPALGVEDTIDVVKSVASKFALPIYFNGGLVWPILLGSEELKAFLKKE